MGLERMEKEGVKKLKFKKKKKKKWTGLREEKGNLFQRWLFLILLRA